MFLFLFKQLYYYIIYITSVKSYRDEFKKKGNDELLYDGSVTRYGPQSVAGANGPKLQYSLSFKCTEVHSGQNK